MAVTKMAAAEGRTAAMAAHKYAAAFRAGMGLEIAAEGHDDQGAAMAMRTKSKELISMVEANDDCGRSVASREPAHARFEDAPHSSTRGWDRFQQAGARRRGGEGGNCNNCKPNCCQPYRHNELVKHGRSYATNTGDAGAQSAIV